LENCLDLAWSSDKFDGIRKVVEEDLLEPLLVKINHVIGAALSRGKSLKVKINFNIFNFELVIHDVGDIVESIFNVNFLDGFGESALLELGESKQVFYIEHHH